MTGRFTTMRAYPSARRSGLLYGNEDRRSQSRGNTGSERFRYLPSPARMIPRVRGSGPGTRLRDIPEAVLMKPGFVAGATAPDHVTPERLPCRLPAVYLIVLRTSVPEDASATRLGIHRDKADEGLLAAATGVWVRSQSVDPLNDKRTYALIASERNETTRDRHRDQAANARPTGAAHTNRRVPPEVVTPSLLATVIKPRIPGNRHSA
jgi:hypothetical protein